MCRAFPFIPYLELLLDSYFRADFLEENEEDNLDCSHITADYLSLLDHNGVPPHVLNVRISCVCSLMRNMSMQKGLVKNARMIVVNLGNRFI